MAWFDVSIRLKVVKITIFQHALEFKTLDFSLERDISLTPVPKVKPVA